MPLVTLTGFLHQALARLPLNLQTFAVSTTCCSDKFHRSTTSCAKTCLLLCIFNLATTIFVRCSLVLYHKMHPLQATYTFISLHHVPCRPSPTLKDYSYVSWALQDRRSCFLSCYWNAGTSFWRMMQPSTFWQWQAENKEQDLLALGSCVQQ